MTPLISRRTLLAVALSCGAGWAQAQTQAAKPAATAVFAGGCFWSVEVAFDALPGVLSTTPGYAGGTLASPTYAQVSAGVGGHAEVVQVQFNPQMISYAQLLDAYWRMIDPTQRDGQFCDNGPSYRTAIFAQDAAQLSAAQASKAALQKAKPFKGEVVTEVKLSAAFYPAEAEHHDFYINKPQTYAQYRAACGRAARLKVLWGK
jgi:peptide-methionine (S)-S-oxide reductase